MIQVNGVGPTVTNGIAGPGAAIISSGQGIAIGNGDVVSGTGTFVDPATEADQVTLNYGDNSQSDTIQTTGRNFDIPEHVFGSDGNYILTVTIVDSTGSDSLSMVVIVLPKQDAANIVDMNVAIAQQSSAQQTVSTGTVADDSGNTASAALTLPPGAPAATPPTVSVAAYKSNPINPSNDNIQISKGSTAAALDFFDVRVSGVNSPAANIDLTVTITVPYDGTDVPVVGFQSGSGWTVVVNGVNNGLPDFKDNGNGTGTFTFTFNDQSTPRIWNLHGTVFTVALPAPAPPASVSLPTTVSSLNAFPTLPTATFASSTQATIVFRSAQANNLSASTSEVSAASANAGTRFAAEAAPEELAALERDLSIDWLIRLLDNPNQPANNAIRPAAFEQGPQQQPVEPRQQQPAQPPAPQQEQDEMSVEEAIDILFTEYARRQEAVFVTEIGCEWLIAPVAPEDSGSILAAVFFGLGGFRLVSDRQARRRKPALA